MAKYHALGLTKAPKLSIMKVREDLRIVGQGRHSVADLGDFSQLGIRKQCDGLTIDLDNPLCV